MKCVQAQTNALFSRVNVRTAEY